MNAEPEEPWSEPIKLSTAGRGLARRLEADPDARARIARALDLVAVEALTAELELRPAPVGWRLAGRFAAEVVYTCGVTLDPFPARVAAPFEVELTTDPAAAQAVEEAEITLDSADPPDLVEDDAVDLAAYVVEHLALELDPFPRKPDAAFEPPPEPSEPSPFASLAALKPRAPRS